MRRWFWIAVCTALPGCQLVTGLNDLEVSEQRVTDAGSTQTSTDETRTSSGETPSDPVEGGAPTQPTEAGTQEPDCQLPKGVACTPGNNCGCDAEETCALGDNGELLCVNPGRKTVGDLCQKADDCAAGLLCLDGLCLAACRSNEDCDGAAASCQPATADGAPLANVNFCNTPCDVVAPADPNSDLVACKMGQTCLPTPQGPQCANAIGEGAQGDSCGGDGDCRPGFTCDAKECKRWCDVEGSACQGVGFECVALPKLREGERRLGVCEQTCVVAAVEGSTCGVLPQCGCPGGQTCRIVDPTGKAECSPTGTTGNQAACETNVDCAAGAACVLGLCRPYCDPDAPMCMDKSDCYAAPLDDSDFVLNSCLGHCDPVQPTRDDDQFTPCGDDAYCFVAIDGGDVESSYCFAAAPTDEQVQLGQYCDEPVQCPNGSLCADRCLALCRDTNDCDGLTEQPLCVTDFGEDLVLQAAAGDVVGVCCTPTPVAGSTCSTLGADCGCAVDESCRAVDFATGMTGCTAVGSAGPQSACELDTDCQAGLDCIGSVCRPHCEGTACDPNQGLCIQVTYRDSSTDDINPIPYSKVCAGHCDPVNVGRDDAQFKPCGEDARCLPGFENDDVFPQSFCSAAQAELQPGEFCVSDEDCPNSMGCDYYGSGLCLAWCRSNSDCSGVDECDTSPYYRRPVEQDDWVGFCLPPGLGPAVDPGP